MTESRIYDTEDPTFIDTCEHLEQLLEGLVRCFNIGVSVDELKDEFQLCLRPFDGTVTQDSINALVDAAHDDYLNERYPPTVPILS